MSMTGSDNSELPAQVSFFRSQLFYRRVILLLCAATVSAPLIYSSRPDKDTRPRAACSVLSPSRAYVRIEGIVKYPGIYEITANIMTIDAIKMAGGGVMDVTGVAGVCPETPLENGDVVNVLKSKDKVAYVRRGYMSASERLVLDIPLNINTMSLADFDKIPGIGPTLAQRIVNYRHKNGGSMQVMDLLSIEGIGENSYYRLKRYF